MGIGKRTRRLAWLALPTLTGMASFLLSAYGIYMFAFSGFVQESVGTAVFCLLPMLSFPTFLFGLRKLQASTVVHWILALAYLFSYSQMDRRTCTEHETCASLPAIVGDALTTLPVEAAFSVAILSLAALALSRRLQALGAA